MFGIMGRKLLIAWGLLCALNIFGMSIPAESQTIPPSVYLPIAINPELPTPTPTLVSTPTPAETPAPTITPTATSRPSCDTSYPTVCIPPPPPDLDCKNIPYRRFKVLPSDPHNFDSDHDGIGCES